MQRRPDVVLNGAGMIAGVHGAACQSLGWPVRAVASRSETRAIALARALRSDVSTYDDLRRRRLADIAIVATPPPRHVDDSIGLLEAGYRVVVEAPIACTLDDADRLIAAEERLESPVLYSEHLVASPAVDALLDRVGGLGHLTHLSARALQAPPTWRPGGGADWGADWGGGALFDLGVHPLGLILRVAAEAGQGAPTAVSAVVTDAGTTHEHATVRVHFAAGAAATVVVGWQPGSAPDWDLQASSASGVLRAELSAAPSLEHNGDPVAIGSASTVTQALVDERGYAPQLTRFWNTVRSGRPVPATSRFGRQVVEVIAAGYWSARHGASEIPLPFTGPHDLTPRQLFES